MIISRHPRLAVAAVGLCCFGLGLGLRSQSTENPIRRESVAQAQKLLGLTFSSEQQEQMRDGLKSQLENYAAIRAHPLPNSVPPAILFNPIPVGMKLPAGRRPSRLSPVHHVAVPSSPEDLAFLSVRELGVLLRTRKVTSEQLTRLSLDRLKQYDPQLHCVITLTEDLALQQARQADEEIRRGKYRGPLHGIPYGAKDLLAVKGYKTTWGAGPYKDQVIDQDATVVRKLRDAGAVLVAKLTLGELAMGDIWFGGKTRNPWNTEQGSSGSSAGSASATAAGLVPFAIGTETLGSIVSPSTRCGTTGLRPTYGRVSRKGAMALSWSMDKIGPICRNVEDCAIVFQAIHGPDGDDQTLYDVPFNYNPQVKLHHLRIAYVKKDFDEAKRNKDQDAATLAKLRELGADLKPITLPKYPLRDMLFLLEAEGAAAFDEMTRTGRDAQLVQQGKNDWANLFRQSRFVPAVEYIQANRIRQQLIQDMAKVMEEVDVYVTPSFGESLPLTNLTGHPAVVLPNGFSKEGTPASITFIGKLFGEAETLAVAKVYQDATDFHRKRPPLKPATGTVSSAAAPSPAIVGK